MALKNDPSNTTVTDPPGLFVLGWRSRRHTDQIPARPAPEAFPDPYIHTLRHKITQLSNATKDPLSRTLLE